MIINENNQLSTTIKVMDENGKNTVVVFLNTNLNTSLSNFSINANIVDINKGLITAEAKNTEGQTVAQQYSEFETEVKRRAKEMGYLLF